MRKQYDFSEGERGKHAERSVEGRNLVRLEPDVANAFPTSGTVNKVLRDIARRHTAQRPSDE